MLFGGDSIWLSGGNFFSALDLGEPSKDPSAIPAGGNESTQEATVPQARDLPPRYSIPS